MYTMSPVFVVQCPLTHVKINNLFNQLLIRHASLTYFVYGLCDHGSEIHAMKEAIRNSTRFYSALLLWTRQATSGRSIDGACWPDRFPTRFSNGYRACWAYRKQSWWRLIVLTKLYASTRLWSGLEAIRPISVHIRGNDVMRILETTHRRDRPICIKGIDGRR